MRLWSLHPKYLDARGLVALWREALLAQAVLAGRTRGYRHHPQLARFRACASPRAQIAAYLRAVHDEAARRGYRFDASRIGRARATRRLPVTRGQLAHEWRHLQRKLRRRAPSALRGRGGVDVPEPHPCFRAVAGGVAAWEKGAPGRPGRARARAAASRRR